MYIFVKGSGHILRLLRLEVFIYNVYVPITECPRIRPLKAKFFLQKSTAMPGKKLPVFLKEANKVLINPRKNGYRRDEKLKKILSIKKFYTRQ
jgi:hypothetical protein